MESSESAGQMILSEKKEVEEDAESDSTEVKNIESSMKKNGCWKRRAREKGKAYNLLNLVSSKKREGKQEQTDGIRKKLKLCDEEHFECRLADAVGQPCQEP